MLIDLSWKFPWMDAMLDSLFYQEFNHSSWLFILAIENYVWIFTLTTWLHLRLHLKWFMQLLFTTLMTIELPNPRQRGNVGDFWIFISTHFISQFSNLLLISILYYRNKCLMSEINIIYWNRRDSSKQERFHRCPEPSHPLTSAWVFENSATLNHFSN